jgi:hypothetical protein
MVGWHEPLMTRLPCTFGLVALKYLSPLFHCFDVLPVFLVFTNPAITLCFHYTTYQPPVI